MKSLIIATAAAMAFATAATAADVQVAGQTFSLGGEIDANYNTGTEDFALEMIPSAGFVAYGIDFEASTTIDVIQINEGDLFQGMDFEAGYTVGQTGLRAYAEIGTDADFEFGDLTIGTTFNF